MQYRKHPPLQYEEGNGVVICFKITIFAISETSFIEYQRIVFQL
ncbi:hypothetical protein HMPREF0663_11630 [Hoylesella oralis ATCC 33269]|uniref:Uncharacterized protein n=1 Tax=Hoylesella oralis ATCC 33269 TaxID=873533 RepID=E7RR29_9BACT|nr:hypothetical protein HMPREF0663_11630 [Hoylesella oralis ATCC 33269]